MDKKILFAASPLISMAGIDRAFPAITPASNGTEVLVLEGSDNLKAALERRGFMCSMVDGRSAAAFRKLLNEASHLVLFWDGEDLTTLLFEARSLGISSKVLPVRVTRVVNKKTTNQFDVYIGRGSIWGNPFAIGKGEGPDREEVIEKYREYFYEKLDADPAFKKGLFGLRGKRLACFCKPEACHGDIIAEYLDSVSITCEDGVPSAIEKETIERKPKNDT